jgi:drug/metabolite transporter (DMT)-like permease
MNHPAQAPRTVRFAYAILVLTMLCLSLNHIIGRAVHEQVPPVGLSFWRWLLAAVMLAPLVWRRRQATIAIYRRRWRTFLLLGTLIVGATTVILVALNFTGATNIALINATQPTMTVVLSWLLFRERLSPLQAFGILCAFIGVLAMLSRGESATLLGLDFNVGDVIALAAMGAFAAYAVNLRRLPAELSAPEALLGIILGGCIGLLPFYLAESAWLRPVPVTALSAGAILSLAFLVSFAAMLMWNLGNQIIGPSRASVFINLIPVFGTALAVLLLGEQVRPYHVAGLVLICLGVFLVIRRRAEGVPR